MPKAVNSNVKGLVQSAGAGFGCATTNNGPGFYRVVKEFDFDGLALAGTDNEAYLPIIELPANSVITKLQAVVTETFQDVTSNLEIQATATKVTALQGVVDTGTVLLALGDVKSSVVTGAWAVGANFDAPQDDAATAADHTIIATNASIGATKEYVYLCAGAANSASTRTAGKVLVLLEFLADQAPTELTFSA